MDETRPTFFQRVRGRLRDYLFDDIQLKLLALLIVGVIWFSVAGQSRPTTPIAIPNIDIQLDNPPPQFAITSSSTDTAKIKVQGPEDVLRELRIAASTRSGDLVAYADLSTFREGGVQIAPLRIRGLPSDVELREIDPPTVRVTLDPIATKLVKVEPRVVGSPPSGYKITGVVVLPEEVTLRGPRTALEAIDKVSTTTVSLSGRTESFERPVEIDVTGGEITVEDAVTLSVRIEEDYGMKQFTVPVTSGSGGSVEPGEVTVTLRGPFPALNQIKPEEITAVVQPADGAARQSLTPQIQISGPFAPRLDVESVSPQQVRWRR
jgi:hypothetical protein